MKKRKEYFINIEPINPDFVEEFKTLDFVKILEKRTRAFAVRIIKLSEKLPNNPEARVIKTQLTKAGTSIGANYREANRSRSKPDFKSKIKICESEASETQYWLEIIKEINWLDQKDLSNEFKECSELLAMFTSISKNLRY